MHRQEVDVKREDLQRGQRNRASYRDNTGVNGCALPVRTLGVWERGCLYFLCPSFGG